MRISDHQDTVNIEQLMEYGHHLLHYKEITGCSCRRFLAQQQLQRHDKVAEFERLLYPLHLYVNSEETTGRGKREGEEEEHHHNAMQVQETKAGQHQNSVLCTRFCCLL